MSNAFLHGQNQNLPAFYTFDPPNPSTGMQFPISLFSDFPPGLYHVLLRYKNTNDNSYFFIQFSIRTQISNANLIYSSYYTGNYCKQFATGAIGNGGVGGTYNNTTLNLSADYYTPTEKIGYLFNIVY